LRRDFYFLCILRDNLRRLRRRLVTARLADFGGGAYGGGCQPSGRRGGGGLGNLNTEDDDIITLFLARCSFILFCLLAIISAFVLRCLEA
jgi:hypothetical protein